MLESNNDILLTFQKSQFRIHDIKSKSSQIISIDHLKEEENLGYVLAGSVSHCKEYICVSDDLKGLYLYNKGESGWKLLRQCSLERRCSNIKFSYDNLYIIVADKSGYVLRLPLEFENYEPSPNKEEEKLRWIVMGHISVLIDFDLHPMQKLIATADRDEKIRVSFYPNCYEIYTFLLGHTKFVSQVKFSSDGKRLYSAGADGYLIIWDLQRKTELCKHKYSLEGDKPIPIVTRMFVDNDKIFLFFKNESYVQIITLTEFEEGVQFTSRQESISVSVADAAMTRIDDIIHFYVISGSDQLNCFIYDGDSVAVRKVDNWLDGEDFSDSPVSTRNKFLETLPKMHVDKTGLQVYYESKEKRLKMNGNKKSVDSEGDDEEDDDE